MSKFIKDLNVHINTGMKTWRQTGDGVAVQREWRLTH